MLKLVKKLKKETNELKDKQSKREDNVQLK